MPARIDALRGAVQPPGRGPARFAGIVFPLLVVVALGAGAWVALSTNSGATRGDPAVPHPDADASALDAAAGAATSNAADVASPRAANRPELRREELDATKGLAAEGTRSEEGELLHGTLILLDEQKQRSAPSRGFFRIASLFDPRREPDWQRIDVTDGRFAARVPALGWFQFESEAILDGRVAILESERAEAVADRPLELQAAWFKAKPIHVRDAETAEELRHVTLLAYHATSVYSDMPDHPGDRRLWRVFAADLDSPFEVPPLVAGDEIDWSPSFWIGATSHAWGSRNVLINGETSKWVDLDAGADLVVALKFDRATRALLDAMDPASRHEELRLRVRRPSAPDEIEVAVARARAVLAKPLEPPATATPDAEIGSESEDEEVAAEETCDNASTLAADDEIAALEAVTAGTEIVDTELFDLVAVELPGIRPGAYVVTLERRDAILGVTSVELVRGIERHAELEVPRPRAPSIAPLAGTVCIPPGWRCSEFALDIDPPAGRDSHITRAEMTAIVGRPGFFRFSAGLVPPGRYHITIDAPLYDWIDVDVPVSGREDVAFAFEPPAEVVLHVVDTSGRPISHGYVEWTSSTESPRRAAAAYTVRVSSASDSQCEPLGLDGVVHLETLGSELSIRRFCESPFGDEGNYRILSDQHFDLRRGLNEIEIVVDGPSGIRFFVRWKGARIPWPDGFVFNITVTPLSGNGGVVQFKNGPAGPYCIVPCAGRYRLEFDRLATYRPIPSVEVEVPRGGFVDQEVELIEAQ
jgi:hypothetical protein